METFRDETTETGDVTAIAYSDGTPGVTFTYDSYGRQASVSEPVATRPLAFRQYGKTATFLMHDGNKNVTNISPLVTPIYPHLNQTLDSPPTWDYHSPSEDWDGTPVPLIQWTV